MPALRVSQVKAGSRTSSAYPGSAKRARLNPALPEETEQYRPCQMSSVNPGFARQARQYRLCKTSSVKTGSAGRVRSILSLQARLASRAAPSPGTGPTLGQPLPPWRALTPQSSVAPARITAGTPTAAPWARTPLDHCGRPDGQERRNHRWPSRGTPPEHQQCRWPISGHRSPRKFMGVIGPT